MWMELPLSKVFREVDLCLKREEHSFYFDTLVVNNIDVDILVSMSFMKINYIGI